MDWWYWLLLGLGMTVLVWSIGGLLLVVFGRRADAAALARFIPDCIVLFRRLLADDRIPRHRKLVVVALLGYLALPFDVVPDFTARTPAARRAPWPRRPPPSAQTGTRRQA